MSFIKGFLISLGVIFAQLTLIAAGLYIGAHMWFSTDNPLWVFGGLFGSIALSWAMYGGLAYAGVISLNRRRI